MRMEIKFNMVYNLDAIGEKTDKSEKEIKEWIDKSMPQELENILIYQFEDEGLIAVENISIKY